MSVENGKVCCNCRHCIRYRDDDGYLRVFCEVDGESKNYIRVMEGWCRHWAKEREVKDGKVRMD